MIRVKIVGPMGYTGGEILRLLLFHPEVEVCSLVAPVKRPTPVTEFLPNLRGVTDLVIHNLDQPDPDALDAVFLAVPNGVAMKLAGPYLDAGIRVIDLSGDFRLARPEDYTAWYQFEHVAPNLLPQAVYGLTEIFRSEIRDAHLLANPGCYPTAVILGLAPLMKSPAVSLDSVICDSKTGVSGAGRQPKEVFHFPQRADNFSAYKVTGHQHIPEMELVLGRLAKREIRVSFTPHLIPARRGILTTMYMDMVKDVSLDDLHDLYLSYYKGESFIRVVKDEPMPSLSAVVGSNFCDISLYVDERTGHLIVISMLDNLLKGAAGQAVQNLNVMFGLPESMGLDRPGLYL